MCVPFRFSTPVWKVFCSTIIMLVFQGCGLECHPGEGIATNQKELAQPPHLVPPPIPTMGVGPNLNVKGGGPPFPGGCPPPPPPPPVPASTTPQNNNLQQGGPPVNPAPPPAPPPPPPPSGGINENSDTKSQNHQNSAVNHPKGVARGAGGGYSTNNHGSNSSKPNSDNAAATMPKRPRKTSGGVMGYGMPPKNAQGNMSSIDTVSLFWKEILFSNKLLAIISYCYTLGQKS